MNFIWRSHVVNNKCLCSSNKFHVMLWIYGFIWTSYEWAPRSIVKRWSISKTMKSDQFRIGSTIPYWKKDNHRKMRNAVYWLHQSMQPNVQDNWNSISLPYIWMHAWRFDILYWALRYSIMQCQNFVVICCYNNERRLTKRLNLVGALSSQYHILSLHSHVIPSQITRHNWTWRKLKFYVMNKHYFVVIPITSLIPTIYHKMLYYRYYSMCLTKGQIHGKFTGYDQYIMVSFRHDRRKRIKGFNFTVTKNCVCGCSCPLSRSKITWVNCCPLAYHLI